MNTPRSDWEAFYGLQTRPFSLTPDLRFSFDSHSHTHALQEVTTALQRREGVVVVTGEVGTGKTMLCRTLLTTFERRTFLSVILDPMVTVEELLTHVLIDFGLMRPADVAPGAATDVTRHKMVTTLQQFLATLIPLDAQAVILIDEAQHLSPAVLEEIRLLANFETDQAKLLQIVLVGQPSLDRLLERGDMQQLAQRIARRCQLQPLTEAEVRAYVQRRLSVASERIDDDTAASGRHDSAAPAVDFSDEAIAAVAAISHGIPRVVNTLCDRALQAGFRRHVPAIDRRAVLEGARHLRLPVSLPQRFSATRQRAAAAAVIAAVAAAGAAAWWYQSSAPATATPPFAAPAQTDAPPPAPRGETPPPVSTPAATPPAASATRDAGASGTPATPAPVVASAAQPAGSPAPGAFEVSVAAFRTSQRAQEVADEVSHAGLPVSTRLDSTGRWFLVIVGPYSTSAEADVAKATLSEKGFTDARVLSNSPPSAR